MRINDRLKRLENKTKRMPPIFLPIDGELTDTLDYAGVVGGLEFERQTGESLDEFKQRCIDFDKKHRQRNQMGIFFGANV